MLRLAVVQIPATSGEDYLVYDGGFPSLKAASRQRGNPGPNPGGRTNDPTHTDMAIRKSRGRNEPVDSKPQFRQKSL